MVFLFSCGNKSNLGTTHAYIGGEIVNPTTREIVVKHRGKVLDTVLLDEKNRFSYKIDTAQHGLYLIEHRPEIQNVYINPGDSILLRANTLAFDESLHFSGKGHTKNNFMADMFLQDEGNSRLLLNFHEYNPSQFLDLADSIYGVRLNSLRRASEKNGFSPEFTAVAEEIIKYENNDLKERYTYLVQKYFKEYTKQFPTSFHEYRENIDFNSELLQCSPGYRRFIGNYLINQSLAWCASSGLDNDDCYNLSNVENVKLRIQKVGELVQVPSLRSHLLEKIAVRGIVMANSRESILSILAVLQDQNFSEEDIDAMRQLGSIQLAYLPGTSLSGVSLINMQGELVQIGKVVDKPTVLFLWSVYTEGHEEEHRLIDGYRKKYPEVDFIGINMDVQEEPAWRVAVRNNGYDPDYEYQLSASRINKKFFQYYLDKLLFLNPSQEVVKGDVFLNSPEFESQLVAFLNQ